MADWQARLVELKLAGNSWNDIAYTLTNEYALPFTHESVRSWWRRNKVKLDSQQDCLTPSDVVEQHGLDTEQWKVMSYRSQKNDSRLTVKPRMPGITFEEIDQYFDSRKFDCAKTVTYHYQYDPEGEILEIDMPDLHSGLFSWHKETGEDYDVKIASHRFQCCMNDIIDRCRGRRFKQILFVNLGDFMHIDNDRQETTKGTFQQSDGRTAKIFDYSLDMLIDGITMLGNIAPVEVVYVPGNHDRVTGYMLFRSIEMAFRNDGNVTFDVTPDPQKFRLVGNTLIGWTHGDMPQKNMARWLQGTARKEFGLSRFAEIHAGHFHSERKRELKLTDDDDSGIIIRYLPTICSSSYWEHQQGYMSASRSVISYVWNETNGLREIWNSNV